MNHFFLDASALAKRYTLEAAQAKGLLTFDPETQSQTDLDKLIGP